MLIKLRKNVHKHKVFHEIEHKTFQIKQYTWRYIYLREISETKYIYGAQNGIAINDYKSQRKHSAYKVTQTM